MSNINIHINLGKVDLESLSTEEEIRAKARELVPTALKEIGETAAETMWKKTQKAFSGTGFKANNSASDKRKFVEEAGRNYARDASTEDKRELEDYIVEHIRELKSEMA